MEKGQRVLVWSLQSFNGGGFLDGVPAFIRQSTTDDGSVILCVMRCIGGRIVMDKSYEVYQQQVKCVDKCRWPADNRLVKLRKIVMKEERIS